MGIRYTRDLSEVTPEMLSGFFEGWSEPPSPQAHFRILRGSAHVVLAVDAARVVGFVTAISDGVHSAFIPLLEVLPTHRRRGIGSELMRRMLEELKPYACIDLACDPGLVSFYARFGLHPGGGAAFRDPTRRRGL